MNDEVYDDIVRKRRLMGESQFEDAVEDLLKGHIDVVSNMEPQIRDTFLHTLDTVLKGEDRDQEMLNALYGIDYAHKVVDPYTFFTHSDYIGHFQDSIDNREAWWPHLIKICEPQNKIHEVYLSGSLGLGKCLCENSLCSTTRGLIPIREVKVGDFINGYKGVNKVTHIHEEGKTATLLLTTKNGYELEGRPNHRVMSWCALEGPVWKQMRHLIPGQDIVLMKRETSLHPRSEKSMLSLDEVEMMGAWTGDGHWYDREVQGGTTWGVYITLGKQDTGYLEYLLSLDCESKVTYKEYNNNFRLYIGGKALVQKWKSLGLLTGSRNKDIPPIIFRDYDRSRAFLRGLFDTDGCFSEGSIEFSTSSEVLGKKVQTLLLFLGIKSSRKKKIPKIKGKEYPASWTIRVKGRKDKLTFWKKIGLNNPLKAERFEEWLEVDEKRSLANDTDIIYSASGFIQESWDRLKGKVPSRKPYGDLFSAARRGKQNITVSRLKLMDEIGEEPVLCEELRLFVYDGYFMDHVKSLEESEAFCYDLTIEDHPSYIANGFISHNSTIGFGCIQAYHLHRILCLREPAKFYGLGARSQIVFGVYSITLESAEDTGFYILRDQILANSPFFSDLYQRDMRNSKKLKFPGGIVVMMGSGELHAAGKNLFFIVIDEMNLMRTKGGTAKEKAFDLADHVSIRIGNRFKQKQGEIPGAAVYIGSARAETDFISRRTRERRTQHGVYIVQGAIWEFKKDIDYSGKTFEVQVGGEDSDNRVLEYCDFIGDTLILKNKTRLSEPDKDASIIEVPVEHFLEFWNNVDKAIPDLAGVDTKSFMKFFADKTRLKAAMDEEIKNPFPSEVVYGYLDGPYELATMIDRQKLCRVSYGRHVPLRHPLAPRYLHVDLAKNKDLAGIAMCHPSTHMIKSEKIFGDNQELSLYDVEKEVEFDFAIGVKCGPNRQPIDFANIRRLVFMLRTLGFWIRWVTMDSWQSEDSIQRYQEAKIKSRTESADRTTTPYMIFRTGVYSGKVILPKGDLLYSELINLDYDLEEESIDHPEGGSKDIADACCVSCYSCLIDEISPAEMQREVKNNTHHPINDKYRDFNKKLQGVLDEYSGFLG